MLRLRQRKYELLLMLTFT